AQILILEILNVFLWLKFSPALTLTKLKRFESGSINNKLFISQKLKLSQFNEFFLFLQPGIYK
ncbi:MAG: hypothetical protein WBN77_04900, partial [Desulfobacterales bacterium]